MRRELLWPTFTYDDVTFRADAGRTDAAERVRWAFVTVWGTLVREVQSVLLVVWEPNRPGKHDFCLIVDDLDANGWAHTYRREIAIDRTMAEQSSYDSLGHLLAHEIAHHYDCTLIDYDTTDPKEVERRADGLAAAWGWARPASRNCRSLPAMVLSYELF